MTDPISYGCSLPPNPSLIFTYGLGNLVVTCLQYMSWHVARGPSEQRSSCATPVRPGLGLCITLTLFYLEHLYESQFFWLLALRYKKLSLP